MPISNDLKEKVQMTRVDGVFTLKLDEGVSLGGVGELCPGYVPGGEHRRYRRLASGRWRAGGLRARRRRHSSELGSGCVSSFAQGQHIYDRADQLGHGALVLVSFRIDKGAHQAVLIAQHDFRPQEHIPQA
jgi:hypothetical protein